MTELPIEEIFRLRSERDAAQKRIGELEAALADRESRIAELLRQRNEARSAAIHKTVDDQGRLHKDLWSDVAERALAREVELQEALANFVAYVDSYSNPSDVPATVRVRALLAKKST